MNQARRNQSVRQIVNTFYRAVDGAVGKAVFYAVDDAVRRAVDRSLRNAVYWPLCVVLYQAEFKRCRVDLR